MPIHTFQSQNTAFFASGPGPDEDPNRLVTSQIKLNIGLALFCSGAMPLLSFLDGFWPIMLLPLADALYTVREGSRLKNQR